jgi:SSS family solute:Na+ symporter
MALWFLCDPMFPQLFQRFLAAKDERALRTTTVLYPLVTGLLFFMPVAIGVMGRLVEPDLAAKAADSILPLAVARLLPKWIGAIALVGGLSALMSTMDSQLLTLSSMIVRDLGGDMTGFRPGIRIVSPLRYVLRPRLAMTLLAIAGLAIALRPWGPILEIATETFTGLAVLFPVTLAAVYWPRTNAWAGFASILTGETLVVLYHFKLLPAFGLLPVIPVVAAVTAVLVAGSLIAPGPGREPLARVTGRGWRWAAVFAFVFLLGNDFWNWHRAEPLWLGLPSWLWYYFGLILLLFLLMMLAFGRNRGSEPGQPA